MINTSFYTVYSLHLWLCWQCSRLKYVIVSWFSLSMPFYTDSIKTSSELPKGNVCWHPPHYVHKHRHKHQAEVISTPLRASGKLHLAMLRQQVVEKETLWVSHLYIWQIFLYIYALVGQIWHKSSSINMDKDHPFYGQCVWVLVNPL